MPFSIRRAELEDVPHIEKLILGTKQLDLDESNNENNQQSIFNISENSSLRVPYIIDTANFSAVLLNKDAIVAFFALSQSPCSLGQELDKSELVTQHPDVLPFSDHYIGHVLHHWDEWLQSRFDCPFLKLENTQFVACWTSTNGPSSEWLTDCLKQAFSATPDLENIAVLLNDTSVLPDAFSSSEYFKECKHTNSQSTLQLFSCSKASVSPILMVRKARVEDCDDVAPLLKQHQFIGEKEDHSLAKLLDSTEEDSQLASTLSLVAVVGTSVVGFLRLTREMNLADAAAKFRLDPFDNLKPIHGHSKCAESLGGSFANLGSNPKLSIDTTLGNADNVLSVNLFCMEPQYAQEADEFLKTAFKLASYCDYIVCGVPSNEPYFPLLNSLTRIENRSLTTNDQALYIASKYGVLDSCTVRPARSNDTADVMEFLRNSHFNSQFKSLTLLVEQASLETNLCVYIVEAAFQIVGVVILTECPRLATLATQFEIREWIALPPNLAERPAYTGTLNRIIAFQLHPLFETQAQRVYYELLRQTHSPFFMFHTLPILAASGAEISFPAQSNCKLIDEWFFPVHSRREIQYLNNVRDGHKVSLPLLTRLQILPSSRIYERKSHVNDRIVVLGSSAVALSFIENLVYFGHVIFKNLVLVSNQSVFEVDDPLFVSNCTFSDSELRQLALPHYAQFVDADIESIDRIEQWIVLGSNHIIAYDTAVIATGLQFNIANHSSHLAAFTKQVVNMNRSDAPKFEESLKLWKMGLSGSSEVQKSTAVLFEDSNAGSHAVLEEEEEEEECEQNEPGQFSASHESSAIGKSTTNNVSLNEPHANDSVGDSVPQFSEPFIIVYGRDLQAYCTIKGLLDRGVEGKSIGLVTPPNSVCLPPADCFNNSAISEKIEKMLRNLNVSFFPEYYIHSFEYGDADAALSSNHENKLVGLNIKKGLGSTNALKLPCQLFLFCDEKSVKPQTFQAINDACLIFDGRLVINHKFETSDPQVYAAGSITKYSSNYQTPWNHSLVDYREVGTKLAQTLLPKWTSLAAAPASLMLIDPKTQLPFFEQSKKVSCQLPGNYYYAHFDTPRLPTFTLEQRKKVSNIYGRELVIDKPELGYFRIHINPEGYIHGLTYYGQRRIPFTNYSCLYQLHQLYVNRLCSRFDEGIISDFVTFLNEDWAILLFHPQMRYFLSNIRSDMLQHRSVSFKSLLEQLQHLDLKDVHPETRKQIYHAFDNSVDRKFLSKKVWAFLEESGVYNSVPNPFKTET